MQLHDFLPWLRIINVHDCALQCHTCIFMQKPCIYPCSGELWTPGTAIACSLCVNGGSNVWPDNFSSVSSWFWSRGCLWTDLWCWCHLEWITAKLHSMWEYSPCTNDLVCSHATLWQYSLTLNQLKTPNLWNSNIQTKLIASHICSIRGYSKLANS